MDKALDSRSGGVKSSSGSPRWTSLACVLCGFAPGLCSENRASGQSFYMLQQACIGSVVAHGTH
jgi:hypothetical protein